MRKNYYTSSNYGSHSTFGGIIDIEDFNTEFRRDNSKKWDDGSIIARNIIADWKFDERCRKNIEQREKARERRDK